jgi:hypothetical protein
MPAEEEDGYVWGNHRGGGGAALLSARSGNQVTKLGQVLTGNKQIDDSKYSGVNGSDRPKTAFDHRTPSNMTEDSHDLFAPSQSMNASPSNPKSDLKKAQYLLQERNDSRAETPTRQASKNSQRSQAGGMASLLSEASNYSGSEAPEPIKTKLSRYEDELSKHSKLSRFEEEETSIRPKQQAEEPLMPRINPRQARNLAAEPEPSPHLFSVPAHAKSPTNDRNYTNPVIDISSILRGQQEILHEMRSTKDFSVKQSMLKSIRWGLQNVNMLEQCTCVGTLGGHPLPPITLTELVKKVLIEFMKCNGCNVGRRSMIGSNEAEGEKRFLVELYESLFLLTGVAPDLVRRDQDGDYEVYYGDPLA